MSPNPPADLLSSHTDPSPTFLTIPTELRLHILEYALSFAHPLQRPSLELCRCTRYPPEDPYVDPDCAVLRVCKHLHREAKPVLYSQNTFIIDAPSSFPPSIAPLVRNVKVKLRLVQFTKCWYEGIRGWDWYLKRWPFPEGSVRKLIVSYPDGGAQGLEEGFAQLRRGAGHGGVIMCGIPWGPYKPYGIGVQEIVIEDVSDELAAAIKHAAASMR